MNADSRPPVAIRITRPYASEDEYLDQELDTLTRTSITLVGAQPRPDGVVLRFEVVLPAGEVLIRGEGRVVGFKQNAHEGIGGLSLRFTRLDMRSKALVDRAAALRERRRPSIHAPAHGGPIAAPTASMSLPPPPLRPEPAKAIESVSSSVLESSPSVTELEESPSSPSLNAIAPSGPRYSLSPSREPPSPPPRESRAPAPLRASLAPAPLRASMAAPRTSKPPSSPLPQKTAPSSPPPTPERERPRSNAAPENREALLERLRARAKGIDLAAVASVLDERHRR